MPCSWVLADVGWRLGGGLQRWDLAVCRPAASYGARLNDEGDSRLDVRKWACMEFFVP